MLPDPTPLVDPPMSREAFLAATLGELAEFWLGLRCSGCTKSAYAPLRLLATKHGRRHQLQLVLKRLRCDHCKSPPATAWLVDYPIENSQHAGRVATWRIELAP